MSIPGSRPTVVGVFDWSAPAGAEVSLSNPVIPLPYRADLLTSNASLDLELVPPASRRAHRKLRDVVEHRSGAKLDLMLRAAPRLRRAEAVLVFLEQHFAALSWARRHRLPPYAGRPVVGISCWWAEELVAGTRDAAEVVRDMSGVDKLVVFSSNQQEIFARAGVDRQRVHPVLFGADHEYFTPCGTPERFDVLAVGTDRGRDWATLVEAARRLPQHRFDIVTGPGRIDMTTVPSNVTVHPPTDFSTYRDLLRSARLVVVPTFDLAYPTGQSVLLEAMACGRCVIVAGTEAMSEYIEDGRWNLQVPPRDPAALAARVEAALADDELRHDVGSGARAAVEEHFTFARMWGDIGAEILELL